jgi:ElaB/YqjD/DUF883 family membrane-anchored ribosome-binding protein
VPAERSAYQDVYKFDFPELRLVSDEVFQLAQRPVGTRPPRDAHQYLLAGKVVCPACGDAMELVMSQKRKVIHCRQVGQAHKSQGSYSNVVLEQIAMMQATTLLDRLTYDEIFAEELNTELSNRADELKRLLKQKSRDADRSGDAVKRALQKQLTSAGSVIHSLAIDLIAEMEVAAAKSAAEAAATQLELTLLEKRISELPEWLKTVRQELAALSIVHPWWPTTDPERELFSKIREFIGSIEIEQSGKVCTAIIHFVFFKGARSVGRTLSTENIGIKSMRERLSKDWQAIRKHFEGSAARLTDAEFTSLPQLRDQYGPPEQKRFLIDVVLVAEELALDPQRVLTSLASEDAQALRMLRVYGDIQIVAGHLRASRGAEFALASAEPQLLRSEWARLLDQRNPILMLDVCSPASEKTVLDDGQWSAVACLFTHGSRLSKLHGDPRAALNSYFALIRERLPIWMAERVGSRPNTIHYLISYRAQLNEVTRRLLLLQGYVLPTDYMAPRRKRGSAAAVKNVETGMLEIEAALSRVEVAQLAPRDHVVRALDLTFNLSTNEMSDRNGHLVRLPPYSVRGIRCFLASKGMTVTRETYLDAIGSRASANVTGYAHQVVGRLRRGLKRAFPEFEGAIETSCIGYRLTAEVVTITCHTGGRVLQVLPPVP